MSQQRGEADRRQKQAHPWLNIHCLSGRRRQHRREADSNNPALPLDWHHPHLLFFFLGILLLCFADAHNTLQLLWNGAIESNVLMDAIINKSVTLFLAVKLGVTAVCLIILVGYHHHTILKRIRVRYCIYLIFAMYVGLIGYELAIWPGKGIPFLLLPMEDGHNPFTSALLTR